MSTLGRNREFMEKLSTEAATLIHQQRQGFRSKLRLGVDNFSILGQRRNQRAILAYPQEIGWCLFRPDSLGEIQPAAGPARGGRSGTGLLRQCYGSGRQALRQYDGAGVDRDQV
jgi:predicted phage tail protein